MNAGLVGLPFGLLLVLVCGAELFTGNVALLATAVSLLEPSTLFCYCLAGCSYAAAVGCVEMLMHAHPEDLLMQSQVRVAMRHPCWHSAFDLTWFHAKT